MLACIAAATLTGAVGHSVSVEVHVSNGLPGFTIVGLPDAAVRESRGHGGAALPSSGLATPVPMPLVTIGGLVNRRLTRRLPLVSPLSRVVI